MRILWAGVVLALLSATSAAGQNAVGFTPDVTKDLGSGPSLVVNDHQVAHQAAAGAVTGHLIPAGLLPANVEITGYHPLANGNVLIAVDTTTALPGLPAASPAEPRDVVEYTPATGSFSVFFDGAAAGIPAGSHIDAIYQDPQPIVLPFFFSLDTSTTLPGLGAVDDEDVVSYAGGIFTIAYDGSAAGVASALDVDAIEGVTGPAGWLLSFDTSGTVGAVTFDDEDVIRYDSGLGTYAMYTDSSVADPADWPSTDLVALPEPGALSALAAGAALLAGCHWRRRRTATA
jgi:hypothetical protein